MPSVTCSHTHTQHLCVCVYVCAFVFFYFKLKLKDWRCWHNANVWADGLEEQWRRKLKQNKISILRDYKVEKAPIK